jgi:hypothetical protein
MVHHDQRDLYGAETALIQDSVEARLNLPIRDMKD